MWSQTGLVWQGLLAGLGWVCVPVAGLAVSRWAESSRWISLGLAELGLAASCWVCLRLAGSGWVWLGLAVSCWVLLVWLSLAASRWVWLGPAGSVWLGLAGSA